MKDTNKQNAITLIALVVTIIVLLILAGVTITTLLGDNILLQKTSDAQFKTEIAAYREELNLSVLNDEANTLGNRTRKFNATSYNNIKKLIPSFSKKYENVLEVEDDELVYKGKDKTFYIIAKDNNLLSKNDLLDDEILEELQPFITEWTVEDGDSITLPIGGICNFTVDYGDGTGEFQVTSATDEDGIHTYSTAGTYTVTINGVCESFDFYAIKTSKDKITKIVQWGVLGDGLTSNTLAFKDCKQLQGGIPTPSKNSFKNIAYFDNLFNGCSLLEGPIPYNMFYNCPKAYSFGNGYWSGCFKGCTNLKGLIPETLFKNCPNVINFNCVFSGCANLTGNIPNNLFENCTNVENMQYAFNGCKKLTGNIPENLFENCPKVTSFWSTFQNCYGLTGNIPENLFKNCKNVISFENTFSGCNGLTGSIPETLFENCPKVTSFSATFQNCYGLTGNIPENLFKNCTDIVSLGVSYYSGCFSGCTGLTGEIPQGLFANCNNITVFNNAFKNCTGLNGVAPKFWERENVETSEGCFGNCKKLSNYNEIPKAWGGGGT